MRVERATCAQRNAHRLEITWADGVSIAVVGFLGGFPRDRLEVNTPLTLIAGQRQLARESSGGHARHLLDRLEDLVEESMRRVRISESLTGGLHLHRQELGRVEAGRHREEVLQASQQESGRDEQDKGEGDLHDDKRTPRELMSARDAHRVFRCATWHAGVEAVACWQQADEQAGQRGQTGGEHEDRPIDGDGTDARQFGWAERQQRVHGNVRQTDSQDAADSREQQRLGQQLADDPCSRCAERRSHRPIPCGAERPAPAAGW